VIKSQRFRERLSGGLFCGCDRAQQVSDPQHGISAAWRDYEQFDYIVLPYN
jgi:hypothetical protein